jgi:hypothetical protein
MPRSMLRGNSFRPTEACQEILSAPVGAGFSRDGYAEKKRVFEKTDRKD